ncbi:MAG: hypothetical protein J5959_03325, partial [Butyrivibrio sp.]|nr:hypothetical protein [Butyrivibrio sp.]
MGSQDEQHQSDGRGERDEGDNLQLKQLNLFDLFPSFEEQIGNVAAADASMVIASDAAFSMSERQIDDILLTGGGNENSKMRIYSKFASGLSSERMCDFLKQEYGRVGKGFDFDGNLVSALFDEEGLRLGQGTSALDNTFRTLSWEEIESRLRKLVDNGDYIKDSEALLTYDYEAQRISEGIWYPYRDGVGE